MNTDKKIKETIAEIQANQELIENYDNSNTDKSLSDLEFKDNRLKGKVEGFKEVEQHTANQVVAISEGEQDEKQPFDFQAATKKMFRVKNELLDEFERLHNNNADSDTLNELRSGIEAVNGKIEALEEMQEAEAADQRTKAYKENRSFVTTPNIHTKTKSETKNTNNLMGTENKIYNKSESVHQEGKGVDIANYFRALHDEPKTAEEFQAIQNSTTSSGYTLPKKVSTQLIDRLRLENPLIDAGAGTVMLQGAEDYSWVRIQNNPVANFHNELEEEPLDTTDVFDAVKMEPKTLMIVTDVARELLQDSANAGEAIVKALTGSISDKIVQSSFISQGAKAPEGLDTQVTQTEQFANGGQANIVNIVNAQKALYDNNVKGSDQSGILSPTAWQSMQLEADNNGRYQHQPEAVADMQKLVSSGLAAGEAYVGDFSNVLYGFSMNITVENYSGTTARKFGARFLSAIRFDVKTLLPQSLVRIEEASV